MAWALVLLVVVLAGAGGWALFRADDTSDGAGGTLLGGERRGPKELPPPPPLPGYRPSPGPQVASYDTPQPDALPQSGARELEFPFVPATISKRFWARLIDMLISGFFTGFITFVVAVAAVRRNDPGAATAVLLVAVLAFTAFYEVAFIAVLGQTPGKMLRGIRVVSALDGGTPTVAQAFVRWLVPWALGLLPRFLPVSETVRGQLLAVTGLLSLLIYLWALWDPRKQGLHDKAAQTLVERFR